MTRRFPWIDPVPPQALLPARWSVVGPARLFARQPARRSTDASSIRLDLNGTDLNRARR
jgi:DNA-binding transcriptional regulator PaaX